MSTTQIFNAGYLKKLLKSKKISQVELGDKTNLHNTTVSRLATGRQPTPSPETVEVIAKFFSVPTDNFWMEKSSVRATAKVSSRDQQSKRQTNTQEVAEITHSRHATNPVLVILDTFVDGALLVKDSAGNFYRAEPYKS